MLTAGRGSKRFSQATHYCVLAMSKMDCRAILKTTEPFERVEKTSFLQHVKEIGIFNARQKPLVRWLPQAEKCGRR